MDEQGFRARLRQARELAGESPRSLSLRIGVSHGTVGNVEGGHVADPGMNLLKGITDTLGISLDWLVSGTGDPPTAEQIKAAVEVARASRAPDPAATVAA